MPGMWKKALIYLGLVEEEDEDLEPLPEMHESPELQSVRSLRPEVVEPSTVRRINPTPTGPISAAPLVMASPARLHVIEPKDFKDAQEIGDKLKIDAPVIMNLQQVDHQLAGRLLAFASGLTYGLSGTMKKVADRVYLLTPANVEVTAEETQRIISERGFFNQF
jgi:cell division inhibitor SepF